MMNNNTLRELTKMSKAYAGIGSRETPAKTMRLMSRLADLLGKKGLILRSGGADGADAAFERGADLHNASKEIYLPWKGFNGRNSSLYSPSGVAEQMASEIHPNWAACSPGAKKLHARNCHQILGKMLKEPVAFVLCWAKEPPTGVKGGTATAVNLALKNKIPVFNLNRDETFEEWQAFYESEC